MLECQIDFSWLRILECILRQKKKIITLKVAEIESQNRWRGTAVRRDSTAEWEQRMRTREIWDMPIQFYESFHLFNSSNICLYLHFCLLMKILGRPGCATDGIKRDLVSFWHCDISCIYDTLTSYLHICTSLVQFYHDKLIKVRMKSLLHTGCFPTGKCCHKGKNYCGTLWHALCSRNVFCWTQLSIINQLNFQSCHCQISSFHSNYVLT